MTSKKTSSNSFKKENLKRRAFLNGATSVLDQLATQITGFFVSPFIVNGLGDKFYGIYHILLDLTSYAQMSDIRVTQVLKWTIAQKRDVAEDKDLQSDITTGLVLILLIIPIIILIGSVISWQAPKITGVDDEYHNLIRLVISMMIFSLIIAKVMDLFQSILRGMNIGYMGMGLRSSLIIITGILKIVVIKLDFGLIGLAGVQIFSVTLLLILFYTLVKKNVKWFKFTSVDRSKLLEFTKLSGWFMVSSLLNLVLMNSDKIILGFLLFPELVTIYVLTSFSSNAMKGLVNALISGVVPGIGSLFGQGNFEKLISARKIVDSIVWLIGFSIGFSIIFYNEAFLNIWVGEGRFAGKTENMFIVLIALQNILFSTRGEFINVTLDLRKKAILMALASSISLLLCFLLIPKFEILGLVLSLLIGRSVLLFGYSRILDEKLGENMGKIQFSDLRKPLVTVLFFAFAAFVNLNLEINSWFELILYGLITSIFLFIVFWFIGLDLDSRQILRNKLKRNSNKG